MAFKDALVIDDRTGRKIKYKDSRVEWTGARVHKSEWEPKHPQLTPKHLIGADPKPLPDPRPDNDDDGGVTTQLKDVISMTHGDT